MLKPDWESDPHFVRMEEILAPFAGKFRGELLNFYLHIEHRNVTHEEIREHLRFIREENQRTLAAEQAKVLKWRKLIKTCPECSRPMKVYEVNVTPNTQTGDPEDKTVWICSNQKCLETQYSKKPLAELFK